MEELTLVQTGILKDVTERVRYYAHRSGEDMLELGKALTEAKGLVPRGEWEAYLKEYAGLGRRNAEYFMQAYQKWGKDAGKIEGLKIGQIIPLLSATAEETEKIAAGNDLKDMSSREIREAVRKAREEEREKARESMETLAQDKIQALAKQRESMENAMQIRLDEAIRNVETEAREKAIAKEQELAELREKLQESREAAEALRRQAEEAESRAKDAMQAAIEGSRDVSERSAKLDAESRRIQQELADKDAAIRELQEQFDEMQRDYLDAKSALAKGDAERSNDEILSASAMGEAVRLFIGKVGRVPYMHRTFAAMENTQLEEYRVNVLQVKEWAEKSLTALETVATEGGVY